MQKNRQPLKNHFRRSQLFRAVNTGEIAVLIGSTPKLGVGVNVQKRLCALHHLDLPWRPADVVQREGRILRPGNTSEKVKIFRYITKGSFDAFSWQVLENKQRFIEQLLKGCLQKREGDDIDSLALSYANVKALAIGNPLIKERCETQALLDRYLLLQKAYVEENIARRRNLSLIPKQIETVNRLLISARNDLNAANEAFAELTGLSDERKKKLAYTIRTAVRNLAGRSTDVKIGRIGEFDIVVPAHMVPHTSNVKKGCRSVATVAYTIALCREGRYLLNIESEKGCILRLSHFFAPYPVSRKKGPASSAPSGLENACAGFIKQLEDIETRREVLKANLATVGGYSDLIDSLKERLDSIDARLEEASA